MRDVSAKTSLALMATLALATLALLAQPAPALDPVRGRLLFENHCQTCHTCAIFQRENRKVRDFAQLRAAALRWREEIAVPWSMNEFDDVVDFVNQRYYALPEPHAAP